MPHRIVHLHHVRNCFLANTKPVIKTLSSQWSKTEVWGGMYHVCSRHSSSKARGGVFTRASTAPTPSEEYLARVQQKELVEDKHQLNIIRAFDEVHKSLKGYRPRPAPKPSAVTKMFQGLLGGTSASKEKEDQHFSDIPTGLYIHGAVGGGKTLCMDLFFDVSSVRRKLRVHFHSFMSDVHTRIHRVKQETVHHQDTGTKPKVYDPILPVAEEIAEETWLLCFDEFQVSRFWI